MRQGTPGSSACGDGGVGTLLATIPGIEATGWRMKDGTCCGGLRAWNIDQCISGSNPKRGEKKLSTNMCNLDSGLEGFLHPSDDADDFFAYLRKSVLTTAYVG